MDFKLPMSIAHMKFSQYHKCIIDIMKVSLHIHAAGPKPSQGMEVDG